MTAVVGKAWGWLRSWGHAAPPEEAPTVLAGSLEQHPAGGVSGGYRGWSSWIGGGWRHPGAPSSPVEEYWEAQEKLQSMEIQDVGAEKQDTDPNVQTRWWNRYLPTSYIWWCKAEGCTATRRRRGGRKGEAWERDADEDFSDYGTPPPSPTPSSPLSSPFRLFAHSWRMDVVPEHYEICFNFLRHLFDLFVVGFLWTVSPPTKLVLEVLGVQGALRLWLHGMAMFLVSTVGMAGLLWLIQEYLPQFALIYGIIQAVVISVSVRQSVFLGVDEPTKEEDEERESDEETVPVKGKVKTN